MKCKIIKVVMVCVPLLLSAGHVCGQTSIKSDADDDVEALRLSSHAIDYQIFWGANGFFAVPSSDYTPVGTSSWFDFGENLGGTSSWFDFGDNFGGNSTWGSGFDDGDVPLGGGLFVLALSGVCYAGAKKVKSRKLKD